MDKEKALESLGRIESALKKLEDPYASEVTPTRERLKNAQTAEEQDSVRRYIRDRLFRGLTDRNYGADFDDLTDKLWEEVAEDN